MSNHTTDTLTTNFSSTIAALRFVGLTVDGDSAGYTVSFDDADFALAAVERARANDWARYTRAGGNYRNKRGHSAQFAAVKRAIENAK